ncbi:hypothetical protein BJ122_1016 [Rhodopseudomonas faecalis]|uniref:Uncharacterized protein n=1 Tax=Rhodopseudomonas faecalis TaxID=99655 RepID=A0A318TN24_9BRAD|nr:hypothetical protein [Rhodopseudomonas faecalis]PYF05270.1 hypothetical protein BJ122_1016 [Rhodopseudomonas faecalis]
MLIRSAQTEFDAETVTTVGSGAISAATLASLLLGGLLLIRP